MSQLAADGYADTRSLETCVRLGLRRSERQTKGTDLQIFAASPSCYATGFRFLALSNHKPLTSKENFAQSAHYRVYLSSNTILTFKVCQCLVVIQHLH